MRIIKFYFTHLPGYFSFIKSITIHLKPYLVHLFPFYWQSHYNSLCQLSLMKKHQKNPTKTNKNIFQGGFILVQWQKNKYLWYASRSVLPEEYSIVSTFQNGRGCFQDQSDALSVTIEQGGQMETVPWQDELRTMLLPGWSSGPYCVCRAPLDLSCQELPYAQLRLCIVIFFTSLLFTFGITVH